MANKSYISTIEEHMEHKTTICQPISKSESSIQTSRQFYYTKLKLGELSKPSSGSYKLSTQDTQHSLAEYHQQQPTMG
ncbi:unnamed protein product [Schistosoma margrebowiei]|uniref:Uncharacterized protein n=1 Tax=Schistosoma margrebowiei TaxID=48269 RepID=A0A183L8R7_9TREM|nr:unnamed protein product [Schistosoma margrebowiei]